MFRNLLRIVAVIIAIQQLGTVEAQLFKGKARRQAGGGSMQQQSRGGMFQRGRERREARRADSGSQNGNMQAQPRTGLFGKPKEPKEKGGGLFGKKRQTDEFDSPKEKQGLFARARERKLERQNQNQTQFQSNGGYNAQSSNSYVRSSQRVTSNASLFRQPAGSTNINSGTSQRPAVAQKPLSSGQSTSSVVKAAVVNAQPPKSQLPSLVKSPAGPPAARNRRPARAPGAPNVGARPPSRRNAERRGGAGTPLIRDAAPRKPDARPTGSQPELSKPQLDIATATLA